MVVSKLWHLDDCCTIIIPCLNDSGFIHTSVGHRGKTWSIFYILFFSRDYIFEKKKKSQKVRNLLILFYNMFVLLFCFSISVNTWYYQLHLFDFGKKKKKKKLWLLWLPTWGVPSRNSTVQSDRKTSSVAEKKRRHWKCDNEQYTPLVASLDI